MIAVTPSLVPPPLPGVNGVTPRALANRVLLTGIRWRTYLALVADLRDRHVFLTYDRGDLEIMAPLFRHEGYSARLGRFAETLAEELEIDFINAGSTTFNREDLERGLEPDKCYYFQNVPRILGKTEIDLRQDPAPDLAIEIDTTSRSLNRLAIYAALGVPEIWRFDGVALTVYLLGPDQQYQTSERSRIFPTIPMTELADFLHKGASLDDRTLFKMFRAWLRQLVGKEAEEKDGGHLA
jgi:Uma2 family endonuclease